VSQRWPFALALAFVVIGLVGVGLSLFVWAPLILSCYICLPFLGFALYRAIRWRASFRVLLAISVGLMFLGIVAFLLTLIISWLSALGILSDSTSFFLIEWLGFSSVVGFPVVGALMALVGLLGALAVPGTRPHGTPPMQAGAID
jgi:hypothetical protein